MLFPRLFGGLHAYSFFMFETGSFPGSSVCGYVCLLYSACFMSLVNQARMLGIDNVGVGWGGL